MITLIDSFSIGVREVLPLPEDSRIFKQFSVGVLDKRYPKGSPEMFHFFALGFTENVQFKTARIIRVK
jgi:hypothetical protein